MQGKLNLVEKAKEELVNVAHTLYTEGLVFGSWGNLSLRASENQVVITPSGISYEKLQFVDMVVVNMSGEIEGGKWKPSIEMPLHLSLYRAREDIKAIIHTHSNYVTAFAVAREEIPVVVEEMAQVVGRSIKVAEYALPGTQELADNATAVLGEEGNAVLLANHGLVTVGPDLSTALLRCRIIERSAFIYVTAKILGTPYTLTEKDILQLRRNFLDYSSRKGDHKG